MNIIIVVYFSSISISQFCHATYKDLATAMYVVITILYNTGGCYNLSIQLLGHYFLNSCFLSENFQDGMRVGGLLPLTHYIPFSTTISFKTNLAK